MASAGALAAIHQIFNPLAVFAVHAIPEDRDLCPNDPLYCDRLYSSVSGGAAVTHTWHLSFDQYTYL
jgi:hypothetical protein